MRYSVGSNFWSEFKKLIKKTQIRANILTFVFKRLRQCILKYFCYLNLNPKSEFERQTQKTAQKTQIRAKIFISFSKRWVSVFQCIFSQWIEIRRRNYHIGSNLWHRPPKMLKKFKLEQKYSFFCFQTLHLCISIYFYLLEHNPKSELPDWVKFRRTPRSCSKSRIRSDATKRTYIEI